MTLQSQEGSAYGAALLAMTGTGEFGSVPEACSACIHEADSVEPRAAEARVYASGYRSYATLYPALQPFYGRLGQ